MAGSHPPRPSLNPRSFTTGSHSPSPTATSSSASSSSTAGAAQTAGTDAAHAPPQRHSSLSEGTSKHHRQQQASLGATPAEIKRQFIATGNERVFPMRNVVQARPSTSRTKTTLGNALVSPSSPQQPQTSTSQSIDQSLHRSPLKKPAQTLSFGGPLTTGVAASATGTVSSPSQTLSNPFATSFQNAMSGTGTLSDGTTSPGSSHPATTPGFPDLDAGFSPKMARRRSTAGWLGSQSSGKGKQPAVEREVVQVVAPDGHTYWKLSREPPIEEEAQHRPGCIQSFGVVIALEEDDGGNFVVQQVSENSGEIINLSPSTLFSATSFTVFLMPDSTDVFLDAVDALEDTDPPSDASSDGAHSAPSESRSPLTPTLPHPEHFRLTIACPGDNGTPPPAIHGRKNSASQGGIQVYASLHRPDPVKQPNRTILELELVDDVRNPLRTDRRLASPEELDKDRRLHDGGYLDDQGDADPARSPTSGMDSTAEEIYRSTVSLMKPIRALNRKRIRRDSDINMVQLVFQIEEQLRKAKGLETFLSVTAGIFKELTGFDRAMVMQFDEAWHARVVAEQVDRVRTRDLYLDLTFPASDVASASFATTKLNILYNRDSERIPMVARTRDEAQKPVDMTRCMLRALPKERTDYLERMGVRATMTISLFAFGKLWGIVQLTSHGLVGHRVSVPIRNLCSYLGESLSRTIERLSYERRLQARRIINTSASTENPSGTFITSGDELLTLFGADFGCLSVGEEAKILGDVSNAQELLAVLEYLRAQAFTTIQMTQEIAVDFPDCRAPDPNGFQQIAGLLLIPLSPTGADFIVFVRKGQPQEVRWAGTRSGEVGGHASVDSEVNFHTSEATTVEPTTTTMHLDDSRKGFQVYRQVSSGKARPWNDEVAETAEVLGVIYSRFINVWREKEHAVQANTVTSLLLANASHEVRTPLNAIVNFLEMALDASTDGAVNENLKRTHDASKSLVHVINDLLDLTRQESGGELFIQEPFELRGTIDDAISIQREEARRKGISLEVVEEPPGTPSVLIGDRSKIRQIIATSVGNAVKYTDKGSVVVKYGEHRPTPTVVDVPSSSDGKESNGAVLPSVLDSSNDAKRERTGKTGQSAIISSNPAGLSDGAVHLYISITDTGVGIPDDKLEALFAALHHVKKASTNAAAPIGLGLAVSARLIENLGGVMSVESQVGKGSNFTFVIPFAVPDPGSTSPSGSSHRPALVRRSSSHSTGSRGSLTSKDSKHSELDSLISAITSSHIGEPRSKAVRSNSGGGGGGVSGKARRPTSAILSGGVGENGIQGLSPRPSSVNLSSTPAAAAMPSPGTAGSAASLLDPPTLPPIPRHREREPTNAPALPISLPEKRQSFHVLVVEDEKINRVLLERRLVKDGHVVTVVEHGGLAVRAMEENPTAFDLILMDLNMPICDGYEASRIIRQSENDYIIPPGVSRPPSHILNGGVPIIAVSANIHERNRKQLTSCGIDGWSPKPIRFNRLQEIMKGIVDPVQRRKDLYRPGEWEMGGWMRMSTAPSGDTEKGSTPVVDRGQAKF
ncbi:hypothetical protein ACM66B_003248 [Microbotryomycetes sp. NB124-2]